MALAASFVPFSFAAPAPNNDLVERASPADAPAALAIATQLYADIRTYTGTISTRRPSPLPFHSHTNTKHGLTMFKYPDATAASLHKRAPADQTAARQTFKSSIASINTLVVKATKSIKALPAKSKREAEPVDIDALVARQANPADPTGLATILTMIILEIGGALNQIIATLGLTATLAFLGPLVASLSLLLASLIPVVNNLLALVAALLDGVLGGLSLALAGLILNLSSSDPTGAWPFDRSFTFDVPGAQVRVKITAILGLAIEQERLSHFIISGLAALDNTARDAGGFSHPLTYSPITWTDVGLVLAITDLTVSDASGTDGRFRFDELAAVYQGVRANLKKIDMEACKILVWRTENTRVRRRVVKQLGKGDLRYVGRTIELGSDQGADNSTASE
ncbi:MAG: hypothetical protein Q9220_005483 [cf. Caloplaca sp. 1 TL-2023]